MLGILLRLSRTPLSNDSPFWGRKHYVSLTLMDIKEEKSERD